MARIPFMPARPNFPGLQATTAILASDDAGSLFRTHALVFCPPTTKRAGLQFILWNIIVGHAGGTLFRD